ncbi:MAG: ABC transporter permease [Draconibacterium sp.]
MLKTYLKIAFRNILKSRMFSTINILGLAIGIASFVIILLYVGYEFSFDRFYKNSENIYRVFMDYKTGDHFEQGDAQVYNMSGPTLKNEFPEIQDFVRLYHLKKSSFVVEKSSFEVQNGYMTDPSWFKIFGHPLIEGNVATALGEPNTIVLTQQTADMIFGKTDPLGKRVTIFCGGQNTNLTVTGVLKDIPENTYLKINFLVSFQTMKNWPLDRPEPNWGNNNYFTFLLVDQNANITELQQKIKELKIPPTEERHNIEPLTGIHLHSDKPFEAETNGSIAQVRFLIAVTFIILLLSWLNYINLSNAKSLERAKEVGVRKVSGAKKGQLVTQFLIESLLLNLVAVVIAFAIVLILVPYFSTFTGKPLTTEIFSGKAILLLAGIPVLGILISGAYPAFVLSGFKPVKILKGKITANSRSTGFRNAFVVAQFLAAIVLLVGTITIFKQMKFVSDQPLGADLNQVIAIKNNILDEKENLGNTFETLKTEFTKLPSVKAVSIAETYPGNDDNTSYFMGITYPDGTQEGQTKWYTAEADEDYVQVMGIEMLAGTPLSKNSKTNKNKIIINETAARKLGFLHPADLLDKTVSFWGQNWVIQGVMEDYHSLSLKYNIEPLILRYTQNYGANGVLIKLNNVASLSGVSNTIQQLETEWKQNFPKSNFQYNFVDEKFASLYNADRKFGKTFGFFTLLAIFIASLGLFGLTFYSCTLRIKEIGVRKVNGAKVSEILALLNKDFVKWIATAFVIATPIAYYSMHKWLENFAYRTTLSWWIFALAGALALGIALLTVSWQSWRAATRNPVEALRYE